MTGIISALSKHIKPEPTQKVLILFSGTSSTKTKQGLVHGKIGVQLSWANVPHPVYAKILGSCSVLSQTAAIKTQNGDLEMLRDDRKSCKNSMSVMRISAVELRVRKLVKI